MSAKRHAETASSQIRTVFRRHREVCLGVIGVALLLFCLAQIHHPENEDMTAKAPRVKWVIRLQDGTDSPTTALLVDQRSGWTEINDRRLNGVRIFVNESTAVFSVDLTAAGLSSQAFVSAPLSAVFPPSMALSPAAIAPSFDRRWRECSAATPVEANLAQFFLGNNGVDLSKPFAICGRTVYTNFSGGSLVHADDLYLDHAVRPPADQDVIELAKLGDVGQTALHAFVRHLRSIYNYPD